jgi:hypothetical protein
MYVVGRALSARHWLSSVFCTPYPSTPTWVGAVGGSWVRTNDTNTATSWDFSFRVWETQGGRVYTPPDAPTIPDVVPLPVLSLMVTDPEGRCVDVQRALSAYAYEGNVLFQPGFAAWFLRDEFPGVQVADLTATCVRTGTFAEEPFDLVSAVRLEST